MCRCVHAGAAAGKGVNTSNIKALIQALPQFRDILGRLSVHIFISRWGCRRTQHIIAALTSCGCCVTSASQHWGLVLFFAVSHTVRCAASGRRQSLRQHLPNGVHVSMGDFTCCPVLLCLSCSELKNAINGRMLTELGELEQNLVYGDMGSAELIKFLQGELGAAGSALYRYGVQQVCLQADMLV